MRKKALVLAAMLLFAIELAGQTALRTWTHPYPAQPSYWEYVDAYSTIYAVEGFAWLREATPVGEHVGWIVRYSYLLKPDQPGYATENGIEVRTPDIAAELKFAGRDETGINLEIRVSGGSPKNYRACITEWSGRMAFLTDVRSQVMWKCGDQLLWKPWQSLRFPLRTTYDVTIASQTVTLEFQVQGNVLYTTIVR